MARKPTYEELEKKVKAVKKTGLSLSRMKTALKESEDRYQNLVNLCQDPIVVIQDNQHHVINQAFTNLFGYTQQDIDNGLSGLKLIQEKDKERVAKRIKERFAGKNILPKHDYVDLIAKDGKTKHCETSASLIQYNGRPADLVILRNITERMEAEEALRSSEQKYRLIAENVADIIWVMDANTLKFTFFSPSVEKILGYTDKESMAQTLGDTLTSESMEVVMSALKDELSQEGKKGVDPSRSRVLELEQIHKNGARVWTEITATFLRDKNGKANEILGVTRDISQRKQVEEEIAVFKKFAEASEQGLGMAALDGGITYANAALCRQLGEATAEDARGKNVRGYYSEEQRVKLENEILPAVMEKGYWTGELDLLSIKGNITHTIHSLFLIRDKDETPVYLANVITDITERRQTEERIRTLTQELITAQENERQRISRELHDHVAQDLAAMRMTCGFLLNHERALGDDVHQEVLRISDTLGATIADIRDLSYDLRPPDLEEWGLARSISLYCEDFSQKSALEVEFHPTGIDNLKLKTDSGIHIFRLIQEGLNNIWNHADASQAIIKLVGASPNMILRIEDNGRGFDVNSRMVQAMEEKRMGLRNMEERARLLNGQMKIQSRPRVGTIISIKFPYAESKDASKKGRINL